MLILIHLYIIETGILHPGAWEGLPEAKTRAVMETNFYGTMLLTRAVLPQVRKQGSGYISMISSLSGIAGLAGGGSHLDGDLPRSRRRFYRVAPIHRAEPAKNRWDVSH